MKLDRDYPGLCTEFTPAGTPRWRVRVQGQKTKKIGLPIGMTDKDPEFDDAYAAAREGKKYERKPSNKVSAKTLDDLRLKYVAAMQVMLSSGDLQQTTVDGRTRGLEKACDVKKGKVRLGSMKADLPEEAFYHILDSFGVQTGAAENTLKALKAAYKWGRPRGYSKNPEVFLVPSPHKGKGGAMPWTSGDEAKFLEHHGPGTMARRWFWLAKNMAGRIGDTHDIGPTNIKLKNGRAYLAWQPKKKGSKPVEVPLMLELANELQGDNLHDDAFLVNEYGRPFASSGSLDNRIRKWVLAAGLFKLVEEEDPETKEKKKVKKASRSQHGIRKATAQELAHAGASVFEIAARLSHSDAKSSAPYVADVDRARLAESGFERVQNASAIQGVPRPKNRGTLGRDDANDTKGSEREWQPVGESNPSFQVENLAS